MKDFGYDVSDYRDVDPMFRHAGRLRHTREAHGLGLRVMIDLVLYHSSEKERLD
jgi:alpha-glucosidase